MSESITCRNQSHHNKCISALVMQDEYNNQARKGHNATTQLHTKDTSNTTKKQKACMSKYTLHITTASRARPLLFAIVLLFFLPCILHNSKKQTWTHIATKTTTGVACQQASCQSYAATCTNAKPARIYQTFNKNMFFFVLNFIYFFENDMWLGPLCPRPPKTT